MTEPESERLVFRNYTQLEKPLLIELFTDREVMAHVGDGVLSTSAAEELWQKLLFEFYPAGKITIWAVFSKDGNDYAGHASIRPRPEMPQEWEIGYILNKGMWGNGFATEIAKSLVEYGFKVLELPAIYATVDDKHKSSIRVLQKAGLEFLRFEFDEQGRYSVYRIRNNGAIGNISDITPK